VVKFLLDPLFRRFLSGSLFAGVFVWVAVTHFNVETEIVWVFFLLSFVFIGVMIAVGLILAPVVTLLRRKSEFLSSLEQPEKESEDTER
jgi:type VI protein secretion system component VasK